MEGVTSSLTIVNTQSFKISTDVKIFFGGGCTMQCPGLTPSLLRDHSLQHEGPVGDRLNPGQHFGRPVSSLPALYSVSSLVIRFFRWSVHML